jgi:hypothetical protein
MTHHTTPILIALLSVPFVGCQEHPSDSSLKADASSDPRETDSADGKAEDALHIEIEPPDIGIQGPITGPLTDTPPPAYPSLHCTTEGLGSRAHPTAIRVQLYRGEDQSFFAYQNALIHPDTSPDPTRYFTEMSGVVNGEWTDERLDLWMSHTDDNGTTSFGMLLDRDERTQGTMYTGIALAQSSEYEMTCWAPSIEPDFLYDATSGECTDDNGLVGSNPWPIHMVRETRDGECTRLVNVHLNEHDYNFPDLEGWNLRGAVLQWSMMHSANLVDANLEGADLGEFWFGYADITGSIDIHTQRPATDCDVGYSGDLHCWN